MSAVVNTHAKFTTHSGWTRAGVCLLTTLFLALSGLPAHGFERLAPDRLSPATAGETQQVRTALGSAETCRALLTATPAAQTAFDSNPYSTDRGRAAALSLVLGLRIALGGSSPHAAALHPVQFAAWQPGVSDGAGDSRAQAIMRYRDCRAQAALRAWGSR